jgi:hypothetical protein
VSPPFKLDHQKYLPDANIVKDSQINPKLVKKRPENQLRLPRLSQEQEIIYFKNFQD